MIPKKVVEEASTRLVDRVQSIASGTQQTVVQNPDLSYVYPQITELQKVLQPLEWKEQRAKRWWDTKIAERGMQLEKDGRRQLINERLIKKYQDGTLGQQTTESMDEALKDDPMGVRIGDHQHIYLPPQLPPPIQEKSLLEKALPVILSAAIGAGAVWYLTKEEPEPTIFNERDWEIQLEK